MSLALSGFSREPAAIRCPLGPEALRYCHASTQLCTSLQLSSSLRFNALFRQCAGFSLLRPRIAHPRGLGIINPMSIGFAQRLYLRSRLTLIRLALIRNPWSYGGRVSRPPYRYLYLHLLFRGLQRVSRLFFCGYRNAPLPIDLWGRFHAFGTGLMPDYYPRGITRLVSCYALFK